MSSTMSKPKPKVLKRTIPNQNSPVWNVPLDSKSMIVDPPAKKTVTVPAGTYYIGDPCYPLQDSDIYDKVWASTGYTTPAVYRSRYGIVYIDSTAYGDGGYKGTDGFEYGVDAGVISIISAEVIQHELDKVGTKNPLADMIYGGKLHTFDRPVSCSFGKGVFNFYDYTNGNHLLTIDTAYEGSDSEEND